jgi:hypothetical protein
MVPWGARVKRVRSGRGGAAGMGRRARPRRAVMGRMGRGVCAGVETRMEEQQQRR